MAARYAGRRACQIGEPQTGPKKGGNWQLAYARQATLLSLGSPGQSMSLMPCGSRMQQYKGYSGRMHAICPAKDDGSHRPVVRRARAPTTSCDVKDSASLFSFALPPSLCVYLRTAGVGTDSRSILLQPHGGTLDLKQTNKAITVFRPGFARGIQGSPTASRDASHVLFLFLVYLKSLPRGELIGEK